MKPGFIGALAAAFCTLAGAQAAAPLDDFSDTGAWQASASDEVKASAVRAPGGGLCLAYDFGRVSGYAVLGRALPIDFPAHYALTLRLRGSGPKNALQVKFVDASGDNVWWLNRPGYAPPAEPTDLKIRQRQIDFAWGPTADKVLRRTARVEIVVASGEGGSGQLCFERLSLRPLPPPGPLPPPLASASAAGSSAALALDGNPGTAWRTPLGGQPHWQVDFGVPRELNGLVLRWADGQRAADVDLQFSDDGQAWRTVRALRGVQRDVLPLWLPDSETRHLRLVLHGPARARAALAEVQPVAPTDWPTRNHALRAFAQNQPRGRMPRAFAGEQNYWTLVGVDRGGATAALLSEDGAVEPRRAGPSLEPFVIDDTGKAHGWADVSIRPSLRDDYLPLPRVQWAGDGFGLNVEAGAEGTAERSRLLLRYTLANTGAKPRALTLALALRPWQVNPPQQFLNTPGGHAPVQRIAWQDGTLAVEGRPWLVAPLRPDAVQVLSFEQADGLPLLPTAALPGEARTPARASGRPPKAQAARPARPAPAAPAASAPAVDDLQALATAVLRWRFELAAGEARSVAIELPLSGAAAGSVQPAAAPALAATAAAAGQAAPPAPSAQAAPAAPSDPADVARRLDAVADAWRARLNRTTLELPPKAQPLFDTLRSSLAHILMSREGAALQPGTRSYARSWVRDGAMMVAGLLRLGERDAAREFVQWYAQFLFANGKVPCCVDARGADPVAENDSHGQFIYAVAELMRHGEPRAVIEPLWPKVDAAARYMETLRQSERTAQNKQPGREAFYGMMPASISHEGYSAKPMHSYWDNFWALAGYRDAALLARVLGPPERAAELARQRDEFQSDLVTSLAAAVAQHRIDWLPGAAELGDFDPSSSTLVFSPSGMEPYVAPALLQSTWERYWRESVARRDGRRPWQDYTPYELRSVSALLRLGWPDRAHAMLDFFLRDRRPAAWNQWAEVVGREPREPRFVGDMPHAWISSDYIRSALDLLAYERESDQALVIGAGVPEAWWRERPVAVRGLGTPWGALGYRLGLESPKVLKLQLDAGLSSPPGGLWLAWNGPGPPPRLDAGGRRLDWQGGLLRFEPRSDGGELRLPLP